MSISTCIRCPRCRAVLAVSDGVRLDLGAVFCTRTVTLHCARACCGGRVVWQPKQVTTEDRGAMLAPA